MDRILSTPIIELAVSNQHPTKGEAMTMSRHQTLAKVSAVAIALLFSIGISFSSCGPGGGRIPPPPPYPFSFFIVRPAKLGPAPIEVTIRVEFANTGSPFLVRSARVQWGDKESWENIDLPLNQQGYYEAVSGASLELTHLYLDNGDYEITVEMTDTAGRKWVFPNVGGGYHIRVGD